MHVHNFTHYLVTLERSHVTYRQKYRPSVYKENVQKLNQMPFTKKGKTAMSNNFEVGEENHMELGNTTAYNTHDLSSMTP